MVIHVLLEGDRWLEQIGVTAIKDNSIMARSSQPFSDFERASVLIRRQQISAASHQCNTATAIDPGVADRLTATGAGEEWYIQRV